MALDDPVVRKIAAALCGVGAVGLSRTSIRDVFGRNVPAATITAALSLLAMNGLASAQVVSSGGGRPRSVWFAKTLTKPCCDLGVPPNASPATTEVTVSTASPRTRPKDVRDMDRPESRKLTR
jgi:hypothetical protein